MQGDFAPVFTHPQPDTSDYDLETVRLDTSAALACSAGETP